MTRVYGGCIEPEGMDLDDEHGTEPCPRCDTPAHRWTCERVEGGAFNVYSGMHCAACGHHTGDAPGDNLP